MSSLGGQHVVVLGGTSGIGFATAAAATTAGAKVAMLSTGSAMLRMASALMSPTKLRWSNASIGWPYLIISR
jgi:NAD(P)-dependent dehydrogenase (short-subunit alcohol dehydrogenase family)